MIIPLLPYYGVTSLGIFIFTILTIVITFIYYKKRVISLTKKFIIGIFFALILSTSLLFYLQAKDEKHRTEINNKINSLGGIVVSIQSTVKGDTPFINWDKRKAKLKDDYYIIKYTIQNEIKTAWFKGDNGLYKDPPTPEMGKWIFE